MDRVWCCRCPNLVFNTYEARHAHICPLTREEQLIIAADKIVELAEKLLGDYNDLHDNSVKDELFGFPLEDAIENYRSLRK